MGIVAVASLATRRATPCVTMQSTSSRTRSAARAGRRSYAPSAHRHSMRRFCPSTWPRSRRPCRSASNAYPNAEGEAGLEDAQPGHRPWLLRPGGERGGEDACAQGAEEGAAANHCVCPTSAPSETSTLNARRGRGGGSTRAGGRHCPHSGWYRPRPRRMKSSRLPSTHDGAGSPSRTSDALRTAGSPPPVVSRGGRQRGGAPGMLNIAASRPRALLPMASSIRSMVGGISVEVRTSRKARSAG